MELSMSWKNGKARMAVPRSTHTKLCRVQEGLNHNRVAVARRTSRDAVH